MRNYDTAIFSSDEMDYKARKYELYTDGNDTQFIVGYGEISGGERYVRYNRTDVFPEILNDAMYLAEDFPSADFRDWDEVDKKRGIEAALRFYNKYSHLSIQFINDEGDFFYEPRAELTSEFFYPLPNEKEYVEKIYNLDKKQFEEYRETVKKNLKNKIYKEIERPKVIYAPRRSEGEPVWMFFDLIWWLRCCAVTFDRFRRDKPDINSDYKPTKFDNIERLIKKFNFSGYAAPFIEDVEFTLNGNEVIEIPKSYDKKQVCTIGEPSIFNKDLDFTYSYTWPSWDKMLSYFGGFISVFMFATVNNKGELKVEHSTSTLFHSMYLQILLSVENRSIRFCKNCDRSLNTDNPKVEYCSEKCRGQYNTRMWRQRKAEKEAKESCQQDQ